MISTYSGGDWHNRGFDLSEDIESLGPLDVLEGSVNCHGFNIHQPESGPYKHTSFYDL